MTTIFPIVAASGLLAGMGIFIARVRRVVTWGEPRGSWKECPACHGGTVLPPSGFCSTCGVSGGFAS